MADKTVTYNLNTIVGGFADRGSFRSSRRKYTRNMFATNIIASSFPKGSQGKTWVNITFFKEYALRQNPHDDPLVFIVQQWKCDIKRILIDLGNSTEVLFWDAFQKLQLNPNNIKMFIGSLTGLLVEQTQIMCHKALKTTYGEGTDAREINVYYLIVNAISPYNIILGRPTINTLRAVISMLYLTLKYSLPDG